MKSALSCHAAWLAVLVFMAGCSEPNPTPQGPAQLVPIQGVVTVDGEPLAGAIVTFLPTDQQGSLTVSETGADGSYLLRYQGSPGTAPGPYKVGISYFETPEGRVMGLGPRSALAPPVGFDYAAERLPARYSDLGQTILTAEVTDRGGTFDFPLEGPLLDRPIAEDDPELEGETEGDEGEVEDPAQVEGEDELPSDN